MGNADKLGHSAIMNLTLPTLTFQNVKCFDFLGAIIGLVHCTSEDLILSLNWFYYEHCEKIGAALKINV